MSEQRFGGMMQTVSGRAFWPVDPRPHDIHIEDIAHALSMMCRYGGHCNQFYSVAEHSVHVSNNVPSEDALWGLLHDAAEAYIADIVQPAKHYISGYDEAENRLMQAICRRFNIPTDPPPSIKIADRAILVDEVNALMKQPTVIDLPQEGLGVEILALSPADAKELFMSRFEELIDVR